MGNLPLTSGFPLKWCFFILTTVLIKHFVTRMSFTLKHMKLVQYNEYLFSTEDTDSLVLNTRTSLAAAPSGTRCVHKPHGFSKCELLWCYHYIDVIMSTMASQITSLTVVYSTVYSDADQRKHQSSASLAFVWRIHRDRWIPRTKGQLRGKYFHLMTSSCLIELVT